MALDDGIYREVDQDVEEEKQVRQLKQAAPFLIAAMVLIVAVIGGRQVWDARRTATIEENATAFYEAQTAAGESDDAEAWNALRREAPSGYAAMAAFREAAALARAGDDERAIAVFESIAADEALPERLRNFARLRAAYIALDDSGEAALRLLSGMQEANTVLAAYAKEVAGLAAMQTGEYERAEAYFSGIERIPGVPPSLLARASEYVNLAALAADGVSLEGESMGQSLERLLDLPPPGAPTGEGAATQADMSPADDAVPTLEETGVSDENDTEQGGTSGD